MACLTVTLGEVASSVTSLRWTISSSFRLPSMMVSSVQLGSCTKCSAKDFTTPAPTPNPKRKVFGCNILSAVLSPSGPITSTVVPIARGDVRELDVVVVASFAQDLLAQRDQHRVQPQLQDAAHLTTGLGFQRQNCVEVPRVQYQRLLADHVGARTQAIPHVRVVQIVGRADRQIVDAGAGAALLVEK